MLNPSAILSQSNLYGTVALHAQVNGQTKDWNTHWLSWLDDAETTEPAVTNGQTLDGYLYPRTNQLAMIGMVDVESAAKYDWLVDKGQGFDEMEDCLAANPDQLECRHASGHEYQGYPQGDWKLLNQSYPFETTGPRSLYGSTEPTRSHIYAGHWLYQAGTTVNGAGANDSTLTIPVANANIFNLDSYVVMYDAPLGSFANAEHAQVVAKNTSGAHTITLNARGYKSTAAAHPAGSIVAEHVLGQGPGLTVGSDRELWANNFSTQCPVDADGKQWIEVYATWLSVNVRKHGNYVTTTMPSVGIVFDTDLFYDLNTMHSDCNNDGVEDDGRSASGEINYTGLGLEQFYALLRALMPTTHIVSGVHDARGFDSCNGNQTENWVSYGNGDFKWPVLYPELNSMMAMYQYQCHMRGIGPVAVQIVNKSPTLEYPDGIIDSGSPDSNAPFRFALALALTSCGFYGHHTRYVPDAWWEEFALDPVTGIPADPTDIDDVNAKRGWMGLPWTKFRRIYNPDNFQLADAVYSQGFESGVGSWIADTLTLTHDTTSGAGVGSGCLRISEHVTYINSADSTAGRVRSPTFSMADNTGYTLSFKARAPSHREIKVTFGDLEPQRIFIGPRWRRYVFGFTNRTDYTGSGGTARVVMFLGRENTEVWIDDVHVFTGDCNVFRRDFDYGISLANGTEAPVTIQLGGPYRKIDGDQDPINDGSTVTSVTLGARDGILLIRP